MKIWIDILTPKQLLFFEPIIQELRRNHQILCTSRAYSEVSKLARIRKFNLIFVGSHGGVDRVKKLENSISRMKKLVPIVQKFSPKITISFCSPEAARISYGLGIYHIGFCDSPHAEAVMKLTLPLIQKLLIPKIIPKKEFVKYGITRNNITAYDSIDAALTIKRKSKQKFVNPFTKKGKKNIIFRMEEEHASYKKNKRNTIPIAKEIMYNFQEENLLFLVRYPNQARKLKKTLGKKTKVSRMTYDGIDLLNNTDFFLGSGGTMTAESALMGIPTISYHAVPNIVENYLAKKKLLVIETNPKKIVKIINSSNPRVSKSRANKILKSMKDPITELQNIISQVSLKSKLR